MINNLRYKQFLLAIIGIGLLIFITNIYKDEFKTEVITYQPKESIYPKVSGSCNNTSRATQGRPNTFRCSVGNETHDPCFLLDSGIIVCDSNPKNIDDEFELIIQENLPTNEINYNENTRFNWAYELQDGTMCFLIQGTAGTLDTGETFFYNCENNKIIIGDVNKNKLLWEAQVGILDQELDSRIINKSDVTIIKAW